MEKKTETTVAPAIPPKELGNSEDDNNSNSSNTNPPKDSVPSPEEVKQQTPPSPELPKTPAVEVKVPTKGVEIAELIADNSVIKVRNLNAPKGCEVVLHRDAQGKVKMFEIQYSGKKVSTEINDYKSLIAKSTSPDWIVVEKAKKK